MNRIKQGVLAGIALALAACGSVSQGTVPAGQAPGPALTVERFLQSANANDLETMTELFGTSRRTIDQLDGRTMAERRMYVLASLLRHDDFSFVRQESMPGRIYDAAVIHVQLRKDDTVAVVPFTVVRKDAGGWIIEQIDLEPVTNQD